MKRLTKKDTSVYGGIEYVLCNHTDEECNDWCMYKKCVWIENALKKLKEYEDLEGQEKLIILPCKVGDKIYHIEGGYIYEFDAEKIEIRKEDGEYIYCIDSMDYRKDDFGKLVFMSQEEAEQALAKMKEV